jgi:hypothetical protein
MIHLDGHWRAMIARPAPWVSSRLWCHCVRQLGDVGGDARSARLALETTLMTTATLEASVN